MNVVFAPFLWSISAAPDAQRTGRNRFTDADPSTKTFVLQEGLLCYALRPSDNKSICTIKV